MRGADAARGGAGVHYSILGPLEAVRDGRRIGIDARRPRAVLAALLLEPGRLVPVSRLIDAVWEAEHPATAREQIHKSVSELRRHLGGGGAESAIHTRPPGYAIELGDDELDARVLESKLSVARTAASEARWDDASTTLREALALWRGPTLDGLTGPVIRRAAAQLDERRMALYEEYFDLQLRLGRHDAAVGELAALAAQDPLREGFISRLMLAFHRSGRSAEALRVYRRTRQRHIDELGLEPGENLRRLEAAILRGDDSLAAPTTKTAHLQPKRRVEAGPRLSSAPCSLPALVHDVSIRSRELADIQQLLMAHGPGHAAGVAITGRLGAGKTALALRAAHRLLPAFPDGVVYLDLEASRGGVDPADAVSRIVRVLGCEAGACFAGQVDALRVFSAAHRVLFVLDDAPADQDLMHLLPGPGESAAIVIGRRPSPALSGVYQRIELGALDAADGARLLAAPTGHQYANIEQVKLLEVLRRCDHLPLAVHGCGLRLAARPHWTLAHLREKLTDDSRALEVMSWGAAGLRERLAVVCDALEPEARTLLRKLCLTPTSAWTAETAAVHCDLPRGKVEDLLDALADAGLVEPFLRDGTTVFEPWSLAALYVHERRVQEPVPASRAVTVCGFCRQRPHPSGCTRPERASGRLLSWS